jgi:hypothetical protein
VSLSLPDSQLVLNGTDKRDLREFSEQAQRNFDKISSAWPRVPRTVRGRINGAVPSILQGTGFSVAKLFVGVYTVTYDETFAATPIVVLTTEIVGSARLANPAAGFFQLALENNAGAAVDGVFTFTAVES